MEEGSSGGGNNGGLKASEHSALHSRSIGNGSSHHTSSSCHSSSNGMKRSSGDRNLENQLIDMIGKGPVRRYGPVCQAPPIQKRLERLNVEHLDAYVKIKAAYDEYLQGRKKPSSSSTSASVCVVLPEDLVLRAAVIHNFDEGRTLELLRRMEERYWNVTAKQLEKDLKLQMCVPIPHVKTKVCQDIVYYVPAQFEAKERSSSVVVSLMTYVMNCTYERYRDRRRKLCMVVNLADWKFDQHFRLDCWLQLMDLWQGRSAPLRVSQVLMVNATDDFQNKAWTTIKTMCNPTFVQRVHFLENPFDLGEHISSNDYKDALPAELGGNVPTAHLVRDFLAYRVTLERLRKLNQSVNQSKFIHHALSTPAPTTPTTPQTVPETPKTVSKNAKNLFQSSILDIPNTPGLTSTPSRPIKPKVSRERGPDTPALSRRSFMSRNSSMPMLTRNNRNKDQVASAIVEVDSASESEDENRIAPTPTRKRNHKGNNKIKGSTSANDPYDDPAVTAVQFQPAALAAVAADYGKSLNTSLGKRDEDSSDRHDDDKKTHNENHAPQHQETVPEAPQSRPSLKAQKSRRNRPIHRTASVPRLMGGLGLSKAKSRIGKNLMMADDEAPEAVASNNDEDKSNLKNGQDKSHKGGRSSLLKNMGRKALNRFASMRNVTTSKSLGNKDATCGGGDQPTSSHTSGLDFDYEKEEGAADTHLSCHGSKHGRGFQMLG